MNTKRYDVKLNRGQKISGLFVFSALSVFLVMLMLVACVGTKNYVDISSRSEYNYDLRTPLSYVSGKIRGADSVAVAKDMLILSNDYEGEEYITYIYYKSGGIYEYFGRANDEFDSSLGDMIVSSSGFNVKADGDMIYVIVKTENDKTLGMHVYAQGGVSGI